MFRIYILRVKKNKKKNTDFSKNFNVMNCGAFNTFYEKKKIFVYIV